MPRFDRTYRMLVGKPGAMGHEVRPPFQMAFDVSKDTKEEPNESTVRVWNLAEETRTAWEEPDSVVMLYAGYARERGPVLLAAGHITHAWTETDRADTITHISFHDGFVPVRDTVVTLSYAGGVRAERIIKDIAKAMKLPLKMGRVPDRAWQHGFSFYGAAYEALHKVVRGTGLEWSVQNGTLQIIEEGKTTETVYVLHAGSGLIGSPKRTRKGAREKAQVKDKKTGDNKTIVSSQQQKDGWQVQSLLLPDVLPGDRVKLESRFVQGVFRVDKISHNGDFMGGDWMSELDLVTI